MISMSAKSDFLTKNARTKDQSRGTIGPTSGFNIFLKRFVAFGVEVSQI